VFVGEVWCGVLGVGLNVLIGHYLSGLAERMCGVRAGGHAPPVHVLAQAGLTFPSWIEAARFFDQLLPALFGFWYVAGYSVRRISNGPFEGLRGRFRVSRPVAEVAVGIWREERDPFSASFPRGPLVGRFVHVGYCLLFFIGHWCGGGTSAQHIAVVRSIGLGFDTHGFSF